LFISANVQSIARSSYSEPDRRFPNVSVCVAMRFHAALSLVALEMIRVAASR
jgi:hypothetical protein